MRLCITLHHSAPHHAQNAANTLRSMHHIDMVLRAVCAVAGGAMSKELKPEFQLLFVPEGNCDRPEAFRRLKALLKSALRSYRMRCRRVEEIGVAVIMADGMDLTGGKHEQG